MGLFALLAVNDGEWQRYLAHAATIEASEIAGCSSQAQLVETTRHYSFSGARAAEANQSFRNSLLVSNDFAGRQKRFAGQADWHIEWRTCLEPRVADCRIGGIRSTVNVTYTLPQWSDRDLAPPALRQRWERYAASLEEHERGHGRIALQVARLIEAEVVGLSDPAGCDAVNQEASRRVEQLMRRGEAMQNEYDRATAHGSAQGAVFPF